MTPSNLWAVLLWSYLLTTVPAAVGAIAAMLVFRSVPCKALPVLGVLMGGAFLASVAVVGLLMFKRYVSRARGFAAAAGYGLALVVTFVVLVMALKMAFSC